MKILSLHVDYINFKPLKKALKKIGALSEEEMKGKKEGESLVVLTAVEAGDNVEKSAKELVKNVEDIAGKVKAKNIVLYPYAHLSNSLASPEVAVDVLEKAEKALKKNYKVTKAPFGYYKEFELKVKGHPLSELSREIKFEEDGEVDSRNLLRKMEKVKMSTQKPPNGLRSNIELGRDLDLYMVSEIVGGGLPLFTPKGTVIKRELERFITDEELKRGYLYTSTPIMASSDLYKISGHWQHYRDSMFVMDVRGKKFALRPMTCPFQFILYKRKPRSYKELPIKYAEIATLFRNEKSGELRGLSRVRQFNLADAHIICRPDQVEEEFIQVLDLIKYVMKTLGVEKQIWYQFSKWDPKDKEKYIQNPKAWDESQKMMKRILNKVKLKYVEAKGEAAFYGPKLDLQYKDVFGKEDTLFTVQIDFALPERYDMTYLDKDNKHKRPMIIHRSSIGATERIIAFLLESKQGNLPLWLSPVQVKVLGLTKRNKKIAEKIHSRFIEEGIRSELDTEESPVGGRIRHAEISKIPYVVLVGDKEQKNKTLAVRSDGKVRFNVKVDAFVKSLKKEINERK
ncbi:MAG TPA: threonine--tRNA ligase [Candidatus Pacearchaeota archaeon]|nr:threonine--tRNA ligase [Candidatus Pacearchaeota archaeon]